MPYTDEQIARMGEQLNQWLERASGVNEQLLLRRWRSPEGDEFGRHGLARRFADLTHTAERIFDVLPPNEQQPDRTNLRDATAFMHCFVINCAGAIDNAARIWVYERNVRRPNGTPLSRAQIGFGAQDNFQIVMATLPDYLRDRLLSYSDWRQYLTSYRDALAHRIPPYIPPRHCTEADGERYNRLGDDWRQAFRAQDYNRCDAIVDEQRRLGTFEPTMMHSFSEQAQPMKLHPQLICDIATIVDIVELTLLHIDDQ